MAKAKRASGSKTSASSAKKRTSASTPKKTGASKKKSMSPKNSALEKKTSASRPSSRTAKRRSSTRASSRHNKNIKKKNATSSYAWLGIVASIVAVGLVAFGFCLGRGCGQDALQNPFVNNNVKVSDTHFSPKDNTAHSIEKKVGKVPAKGSKPHDSKLKDTNVSPKKPSVSHPKAQKLSKPKEQHVKPPRVVTAKRPAVTSVADPSSVRKPLLAIIIDDVHTAKQIKMIRDIGYPVTPAIFPPYSLAPHTERLTRLTSHYMVHLPMESGNAKFNRQTGTLMRSFSDARLEEAIAALRFAFPRAHFVNNHTGSRFTEDAAAMGRLYEALKRYDFAFIDSKTTGKSTVKRFAREYGDAYLARDIFLDNVKDPAYIRRQLRKAIAVAKKRGYAIAIGHPHPVTLRTLKQAKGLLKGVRVVYIEELARSVR